MPLSYTYISYDEATVDYDGNSVYDYDGRWLIFTEFLYRIDHRIRAYRANHQIRGGR